MAVEEPEVENSLMKRARSARITCLVASISQLTSTMDRFSNITKFVRHLGVDVHFADTEGK